MSENTGFKMNWLALWVAIVSLIIIGWSLGLLVSPPAAEMIRCPEEDMVEVISDPEKGGVVVICVDYTE